MKLDASTLRRVSPLLDEVLDLEGAQREEWFAKLERDQPDLAPILQKVLKNQSNVETNDFLERGPEFTSPGEAAPHSDFKASDLVGPYTLIREIGVGGMGEVWLAERADGALKRQVALKLPMISLKRSVLIQRFERERDILASLTHPNIARLYDAGFTETGQPYLALEYVNGQPITEYAESSKLDTRAKIGLLLAVMHAVQYAHTNLVIHRDLKPANVLVSADGKVHLLDFGIAKLLEDELSHAQETELTRIGGRALTLGYAAPEQVRGLPVSTATDVFAAGVLLYELLTQSRPFSGTRLEVEQAILNAEPKRPAGLPEDLTNVVLKALKKSPTERYATMNGFTADLENWLQGNPVTAQPDRLGYRLRKFAGRHRVGVVSSIVVSFALIAATGISVWQASIAKRESQTADAVERFLLEIFKKNSAKEPDPEKARKTTVRELLDIGAKRIATEMEDAPYAKERILGELAELYDDLELLEPSLELRRQQVKLLRTIEPNDSVKLAVTLGKLAGRAEQASAKEESQSAFTEATAIFERRGDFDTRERGDLEATLAGAQVDWADPKASETAQRAVDILRKYPPSSGLIWALELLAFEAVKRGDVDTSLKLNEEAARLAPQVTDLQPAQEVGLQLGLARGLTDKSRFAEAERAMRDAFGLASEKLGPDARLTVNAAIELALLYRENGEVLKALDVYRPVVRSAQNMLDRGERNWLYLITIAEYGHTLTRAGRIDEGLKVIQTTQKARDILDTQPRMDYIVQTHAAEAYSLSGADTLAIGQIETLRKLEAKDAGVGKAQKMERFAALMRADTRLIGSLLAQGKQAEVPPNEQPNAALRRLAPLAEVLFGTGDLDGALGAAKHLIDTLSKSKEPSFDGDVERRALLIAGKVHVLQKRPAEAIALLQRALNLAEGRLDTQMSPHHADALIWLGMAHLASGHMPEAKKLADQAKAIHDRHSRLAIVFRKPLAELTAKFNAS